MGDETRRARWASRVRPTMGKGMELESLQHLKSSPLLSDEARTAIDEMIAEKDGAGRER